MFFLKPYMTAASLLEEATRATDALSVREKALRLAIAVNPGGTAEEITAAAEMFRQFLTASTTSPMRGAL